MHINLPEAEHAPLKRMDFEGFTWVCSHRSVLTLSSKTYWLDRFDCPPTSEIGLAEKDGHKDSAIAYICQNARIENPIAISTITHR